MKNGFSSVNNRTASIADENLNNEVKSTNINVLLNRVKLDQKKENRKKICVFYKHHVIKKFL